MKISRRALLRSGALATASSGLGPVARALAGAQELPQRGLPPAFDNLKPLREQIRPITPEEFQGRLARAQRLMNEAAPRFDGLYITPGTSLLYFTGIRWGVSERLLALLLPREGTPLIVCPAFEEGRLREQLRWPIEVRTWQEDETPYGIVAKWFWERGMRTGRLGVADSTRFLFFDGLRRAAPSLDYASGDPITVGCRALKSEHELALMRLACAATFDVYQAVFASLREGMTQHDVTGLITQGFARMGLEGDAIVLFGPSAALPHGTREEQTLREGEGVLIDGGTAVEGYQSDVTRTSVLGKSADKLVRAFDLVRKAQDAALAAAIAGRKCGSVDDAARGVITRGGFGPGYKYFTHRLGHGLGLDGHEQPYLVRGNQTILKSGMTFSNEPGIYVPGDYGLRLEDDMVIAESGEAHLLTPGFAHSLEMPIP